MMNTISLSSDITHCVEAAQVKWDLWKDFMERYFKTPSSFSITMYYPFRFDRCTTGKLLGRYFSFYTDEKVFSIVQNGVALDTILREAGVVIFNVQ